MKVNNHYLTVGVKRSSDRFLLSFKAVGTLTCSDYELITPMLISLFPQPHKAQFDILIDITLFDGWTVSAAWHDFIVSIRHHAQFHKVAVYGSANWQRILSNAGNWFLDAEVQFFEKRMLAQEWIELQIEP